MVEKITVHTYCQTDNLYTCSDMARGVPPEEDIYL